MKDAAHLLRLAGLFAAGTLLFLLIRHELVPAGFGQYGHFRPAALEAIRSRPMSYAGRTTCEMCHEEEFKTLESGKHARVGCEACHGPQAKHAADSSSFTPVLPKAHELCPVCHETNSAKPKGFPQVDTKEHSGGAECTTCHNPHRPLPVGERRAATR
ncbi:MAG: multiheme c-type cytochrome [Bryobacteraceae bacterium]